MDDQWVNVLAQSTVVKHLDSSTAPKLLLLGVCKVRVADRGYISPAGEPMTDDLRQEARRIDDIVLADRGNAYVIKASELLRTDGGATRLVLAFDTLECLTPIPVGPLQPAA